MLTNGNSGETPADVAYKLNSIDIAGVLSTYESTDDLQAEAQKRKFIREKTNKQLTESKENKALWSQKSMATPLRQYQMDKTFHPFSTLSRNRKPQIPPSLSLLSSSLPHLFIIIIISSSCSSFTISRIENGIEGAEHEVGSFFRSSKDTPKGA